MQEDEIEDLVGDVKYTDSQKSVTTSNVYSLDFTDTSSDHTDKHNSSGKDTYVIDCDSEDSDKTFPLLAHQSTNKTSIQLKSQISPDVSTNFILPPQVKNDACAQYESPAHIFKEAASGVPTNSFSAQETFTQTSKTIIELAALDKALNNGPNNTLETQTSLLSITEIEYKLQIAEHDVLTENSQLNNVTTQDIYNITGNPLLNNSLDDGSSKFPVSGTESRKTDDKSDGSSSSEMLNIINDDSGDSFSTDEQNGMSGLKGTPVDSDSEEDSIEDDSLMKTSERRHDDGDTSISDVTSLCNDVDDLYKKLSLTMDRSPNRTGNSKSVEQVRHIGLLSPLTEESSKKTSSALLDVTPNSTVVSEKIKDFNFKGMPPESTDDLKLPPIVRTLNSNCPIVEYSFTINPSLASKAAALKCLYEGHNGWEISSKDLAAGECVMLSSRNGATEEKESDDAVLLPPIEGQYKKKLHASDMSVVTSRDEHSYTNSTASISIKRKIKELKMSNHERSPVRNLKSRSISPCSESPTGSRLGDVADRGSETLCVELLRRLRSSSWMEAAETLEEMPKVLEKYWNVITESRTADLIRQVSVLVESARTQVSRLACTTLAAIIKNTNYTKKPDFYEAITTLLIKTGSFSRPVRTAANLALDEIVCDVDITHCVTALCLHGAGHKSGLVRAAAARLLVVSCALGGCGRELLRARPPSAAHARRLALSALSTLLTDKNTDARKYAERLYAMLRPLSNFEAYYLTDVDVEIATRQMKKYDQLLCAKQSR